jgi:hypothetical protein
MSNAGNSINSLLSDFTAYFSNDEQNKIKKKIEEKLISINDLKKSKPTWSIGIKGLTGYKSLNQRINEWKNKILSNTESRSLNRLKTNVVNLKESKNILKKEIFNNFLNKNAFQDLIKLKDIKNIKSLTLNKILRDSIKQNNVNEYKKKIR